MKKILAAILGLGIMLQGTAFADTADEVAEIMSHQYRSATVSGTARLDLKKPLGFLEELQNAEEDYYSTYPGEDMADYRLIAESLFDSTADITIKAESSEDYKKTDMELWASFTVPAMVNDNLRVTADTSFGIWAAVDFTSPENFKYELTMKTPFSRKYIFADIAEAMKEADAELGGELLNSENLDKINENSKALLSECLREHASIKKNGQKYTVAFDNDGFTGFFEDYLKGVFKLTSELAGEEAEEYFDSLTADLGEMTEALENIKFLGKDGLSIELEKKNGDISKMTVLCDIDINIPEISDALGLYISEEMTDAEIAFSAELSCEYSLLDKTSVEFPEINEDNCHYINDDRGFDYDYDFDFDDFGNSVYYFENTVNGYAADGFNNVPYLYLRDLLSDYASAASDSYSYEYADRFSWEDGKVIFSAKGDELPFKKIVFDTRTDEVFADGERVTVHNGGKKNIILAYGNTYISPELANTLIAAEIYDYEISFDKHGNAAKASVRYMYPNPNTRADAPEPSNGNFPL